MMVSSYEWLVGVACALLFIPTQIAINAWKGRMQPGTVARASLSVAGILSEDGVRLLLFVSSGLLNLITFELVLSVWSVVRSRSKKDRKRIEFAYIIFRALGLSILLFIPDTDALHAYALVLFVILAIITTRTMLPVLVDIDGTGTINKIKFTSLFALVFAGLLALGELLWVGGGTELWIWFYAFMRSLVYLGGALGVMLLWAFFEGVRDTPGPF